MKISKTSTTNTQASTQARQTTQSGKKEAEKKASPAQQAAQAKDAADRLIQARTGVVGQLLNPLYGDLRGAGDARQKAPDGATPNPSADVVAAGPNANFSMEGTIGSGLQGPVQQTSVDPGVQMDRNLGVDREQLAGGSQVDGRNPSENYTGSGGGVQGNTHSGVGKESAGKQPLDVQASLEWYHKEVQKAAQAGDDAKVERLAGEVYQLVNNTEETHGPEPEEKGWWESKTDSVTETAGGGAAKTPTQKAAEQAKAEDDRNSGREETELETSTQVEQAKKNEEKTGEKAEGGVKLATELLKNKKKDDTGGAPNEDREPESNAPDLHADFTNWYLNQKFHGRGGHTVDYGPNGEPGSGDTSSVDGISADLYTGQYDESHRTPTEEEIAAAAEQLGDASDVGPEVNEL